MSFPGFLSVMSFYLSQIEKEGGANMCLYLAFPLSCLSTNRKVKRGLMLTYVVTWLSVCNVFLVIARYKKMVSTYVCIRHSLYHVLIRLASCNGGGFNVCLCLSFLCHVLLLVAKIQG